MSICTSCKQETYEGFMAPPDYDLKCKKCRNHVDPRVSHQTFRILPGGTQVSSGWEWEVKHRQITPDGDVRVNTGRKYI